MNGIDGQHVSERLQVLLTLGTGSSLGLTDEVPDQINPSKFFSLEVWDENAYNALSDGLKKIIAESDEYGYIHKVKNTMCASGDDGRPFDPPSPSDDDIPF